MIPTFWRQALGLLAILVCSVAVVSCGGSDDSDGRTVACEDLTSSKWKALEGEERRPESSAIRECGVLDGMTRKEVVAWMGRPETRLGNQDSWFVAPAVASDTPNMAVEFDKNGITRAIYLDGE